MTPDQARQAVKTRLNGSLPTFNSAGTVIYEGAEDNEKEYNEVIRVLLRHDARPQDTLGKDSQGRRHYRAYGTLIMLIKVRRTGDSVGEKGVENADAIARHLTALFSAANVDGINFQSVLTRELGIIGAFYQLQVEVSFQYDDRH